MKHRSYERKFAAPFFAGAALCLTCVLAFAFPAAAQNQRRTIRTPQPVVSPTPPLDRDAPQIISRADDFSNNAEIVEQPVAVERDRSDLETEKLRSRIRELNSRLKALEGSKENAYDQQQKRLLLNMDILTRAEQRAEALRKQLFEVIEKENALQSRLDQLDYELRPEMIERVTALTGSLKPEDLRETRKKSLESEKRNLDNLLTQVRATRVSLESNVQKADELVEKVRLKFEKEIDDALAEEADQP